ncbi:MAG: hypothetical protein JWL92_641 [Candidatus Nomurabacteria bacterium]|nr:hypothetical protein [Candidatus Nomurabacteria bacterium]
MYSMKKLFMFGFLAMLVLSLGTAAYAQAPDQTFGGVKTTASPDQTFGGVKTTPATNQGLNIQLQNPLSGISTIPEAINKILSIVIRIALPLIILAFIWAGLKFIFARGKPDQLKEAKNMFLYTIIGTLLILGAWTITSAIVGTVNSIVK